MTDFDGNPPDAAAGLDESVRPRSLDDFIGQDELRANLRVYLDAARERGRPQSGRPSARRRDR